MGRNAVVAGTGYRNFNGFSRASIIRKYAQEGRAITLRREPKNKHDNNAVAVYIVVPILFGLLGSLQKKIGYLKASLAKTISSRMDKGEEIKGSIDSFYAPLEKKHPRVTIHLDY